MSGMRRRAKRRHKAQSPEGKEAEGMWLSRALEKAAKDAGATDPLHYLEYLKKMRRGYDREADGPSKLMALVDSILQFEREHAN